MNVYFGTLTGILFGRIFFMKIPIDIIRFL